ncbi:MAG TPA: alpha-1,4-glucan--maltose-1-phosphate maltosyltransferase [Polyangia bacterium]|jgi:starch synthase (maltosyl-transferring)
MFSRVDRQVEQRSTVVDGRHRVVIAAVRPEIDGGRHPVKRIVGDVLEVEADLLVDGHDILAARVLHRQEGARTWSEQALAPLGPHNDDRWHATIPLTALGRVHYTVESWVDEWASFVWSFRRKVDAKQDVSVELLHAAELLRAAVERAADSVRDHADAHQLGNAAAEIADVGVDPSARAALVLDPALSAAVARHPDRRFATRHGRVLEVVVDPPRARFSAWYEFFPRSTASYGASDAGAPGVHGTFADAARRLPYIADLGFDTIYLPPIHPIGNSHRKGPNNTLVAGDDDVGSPWAIGSAAGGHKAIHPALGTFDDFHAFVGRARALGLEVALDIAFQASPDHPYVREHPEWFVHRADGTIQHAENPPKKYQDVYPFDFACAGWQALWDELKSIFLFWIEQGITVFRVDNPHTKPLPFWEWCIGAVKAEHPEAIFLAEAFTRPKIMQQLAKAGFSQSYTYFTWRTARWELAEYLRELANTDMREYFRPNFWPNTPDILPEHLQWGGRPAFVQRLILAATLSSNYGIYGPPFELMEHVARAGAEEYADNEKYQLRHWDLARGDSMTPLIRLVNRIRRENQALQDMRGLHFHGSDNDQILCYSKRGDDGAVLVVVNLDVRNAHTAWIDIDAAALGVHPDETFQVHDLLGEARYRWRAGRNFVSLSPQIMPAHVFRVRRHARNEHDFEYFV